MHQPQEVSMRAITVRNIPEEVAQLIQRVSAHTGLSLNKTILQLLKERVELEEGRRRVFHDLDHLAGKWTEEEAANFDRDLAEHRIVDDELWS